MIKGFKDKHTRSIYEGLPVKKYQSIRRQVERRMQILDMATCIEDLMHLPSNRFEALRGNRKGQYSIRVNQQWRICFRWSEDGPYDVELTDYH